MAVVVWAVVVTTEPPLPSVIEPSTRSTSANVGGTLSSPPPGWIVTTVSSLTHVIGYVPSLAPSLTLKPKYVTVSPFLAIVPSPVLFESVTVIPALPVLLSTAP